MTNRIFEIIFRRLIRLLVLIILLPAVGVLIAFFLPRSYQSTATLWALRTYQVIGATGNAVDPQSNTPLTPAQSQVNTLTELLGTLDFSVTVAKESSLTTTLHLSSSTLANPQLLDNAYFQEISRHVRVTALGYDTFSISYTNENPEEAQRVVEAVIHNYALQTEQLIVLQGKNLLQSYQSQLEQAKQNLDSALAAEASYVSQHPGVAGAGVSTDPKYVLLQTQVQQASDTYSAILKNISTVNQQIEGDDSGNLFQILDAPTVGLPVSRLTSFLIAGGGGSGLAILAAIVYILILVRRDQAVYSALDLQQALALPVVMELPHLAPATKELV
jgi:uncharacterized protein involved in exopolysaccharide biosynthesis